MHEPPANLSTEQIRACLHAQYGLTATGITFLPLGHDPAAWVYRVLSEDAHAYFLKVQLRVRNQAGLRVPRLLQDQGMRQVVAPLPTSTGALWANAHGYAIVLYPFIAGTNGMQQRLSDQQWTEYGALLRQLHETPVTPELAAIVRRDTYAPFGAAQIRLLDAEIGGRTFDDPAHQALAASWQSERDTILRLVDRAEVLGGQLVQAAPRQVPCHADIHTGNVLLDTDGRVWIVDWDETILAPRERDLMFAVGGISSQLVTPPETARFLDGYRPVTIDPLALAYYRYAWAVADIWAYAETVFARPDLSVQLRLSEVGIFRSLFAPGNIVSIALASVR